MLMKRGFATLVLAFTCSLAHANCKAIVKLLSSDYEGDKIILNVRVFASQIQLSRTVFFSIWGKVRVQADFGVVDNLVNHSYSTAIESGDEYIDEQIEIWAGPVGTPIEPAKIRQFMITGCYLQ